MASIKSLVYRELKRRYQRDIKRKTIYYDSVTLEECVISEIKNKDGKTQFIQVKYLDKSVSDWYFHIDYFKARFIRKERMAIKLDL